MITYQKVKELYSLLAGQEILLRKELVETFGEIQFKGDRDAGKQGKGYVLENQAKEEQSRTNENKNRFYRSTEETKFMVQNEISIPSLYQSKPDLPGENQNFYGGRGLELGIILEDEYGKFSDQQKKELEINLYKRLALVHARRANLANRNKRNDANAMSKKDAQMQDFIYYAVKHNNLVLDEDKIAFGFTQDDKGAVRLDASLPGYTRLSVHFGNYNNFYQILINVNNQLTKDGEIIPFKTFISRDGNERIKRDVFTDYAYNLPTFGVINTGIINRDNYKKAKVYQEFFMKKCKDENGKINVLGIEEYINILFEDFNDREIFYLAEEAGAGKGILEELNIRLQERKKLREIAQKNKRSLQEEYIFSMDDVKFLEVLNDVLKSNDETIVSLIESVIIKNEKIDEKNCIEILQRAKKCGLEQRLFAKIKEEIELNGIQLTKRNVRYYVWYKCKSKERL